MMTKRIFAVAMLLAAVACSKDKVGNSGKNPESIPTNPAKPGELASTVTRTKVEMKIETSFMTALENDGIYTPDVCIQLAEIKDDGKLLGIYLELSSVPCPGEGLVDDKDVLTRKIIEKSEEFSNNMMEVKEEGYPHLLGWIQKEPTANSNYILHSLCQYEASVFRLDATRENRCEISQEGSLFKELIVNHDD